MRIRLLSIIAALGALAPLSCDQADAPSVAGDDLQPGQVGKADGQAEFLVRPRGSYTRVRWFGNAAAELNTVLDGSDLFDEWDAGGLHYVFSDVVGCASDGENAACVMAARRVDEIEGYDLSFHGTAAADVSDALQLVSSDRLECAGLGGEAWCGVLPRPTAGNIWVANRTGGTVSVIDANTQQLRQTLEMPEGGEPMYVNHVPGTRTVVVGDRANDRLVVFDADSYDVLGTVAAGEGVFHQWADAEQIWVNNDVENTTSVIDSGSLEVITKIAMPADLAAEGGKPHDVFIDPAGDAAYVTYVGFESGEGAVVRFDADTFAETHRARVGNDCHVSATAANGFLHVPCQDEGVVLRLDLDDLSDSAPIEIPGAHGAFMSPDGDHFYTTNISGGGEQAVFTVDVDSASLVDDRGVDAPMIGSPHNLAVSADGRSLYVTHSGGESSLVSFYAIGADGIPTPTGSVDTGGNPFGLNVVPPAQ